MYKGQLHRAAVLFFRLQCWWCYSPISVSANAIGCYSSSLTELIPLQVRIYDPTIENTPFLKTPIQVPEVYIEDHTLMFDESCNGCTLRWFCSKTIVFYLLLSPFNSLYLQSKRSLWTLNDIIIACILYLYKCQQLKLLNPFLDHQNVGVRQWAAFALLTIEQRKAENTLREIMNVFVWAMRVSVVS